jgi:hypothetical protein
MAKTRIQWLAKALELPSHTIVKHTIMASSQDMFGVAETLTLQTYMKIASLYKQNAEDEHRTRQNVDDHKHMPNGLVTRTHFTVLHALKRPHKGCSIAKRCNYS